MNLFEYKMVHVHTFLGRKVKSSVQVKTLHHLDFCSRNDVARSSSCSATPGVCGPRSLKQALNWQCLVENWRNLSFSSSCSAVLPVSPQNHR